MTKAVLASMSAAALLVFVAGTANAAGAGGVSGAAFYVNGQLYRTVGTPTDLSNTSAPAHSWDVIYEFGGLQRNVATAAPGDRDYNGGRWQVHGLDFADYAGALADDDVDINGNDVLDTTAEVLAAIQLGYADDIGVVKMFVCPAIPLGGRL